MSSSVAREAVAAALRVAGFGAAQRRADALVARISLSALLPDLSLRVARSTDQSLRFSPTYDDPSRYSETGGAGLWLGATATWHLDRLLFDREELAVERLRAGRAEAAGQLVHRVLELLFEWQRGALDERDEKLSDDARAAAVLRRTEAAVTLDVITAGWFSVHVRPEAEKGKR